MTINDRSGLADSVQSQDSVTSTTPPNRWDKLSKYLWGPDPVNKLGHCYFTTPKVHTNLRYIFMVFHILVLIWAAIDIPKFYYLFAYLTLWGFFFCTVYFSLVNFVKHSHHSRKRWKFVYILGEMAATLELLICIFFWAFLFPYFLKQSPGFEKIVLQTLLHLICPIMIWTETFLNAIEFHKRHIWFLLGIMICYAPVNCIYTLWIMGTPVYNVMTWKDFWTPIFILIAAVMALVGYYVGYLQHDKKKGRPFIKPKTQNEDIVTKLI